MAASFCTEGQASIEIINAAETCLHIIMHEYGDLSLFLTVSRRHMLVEAVLWPQAGVKEPGAFNRGVLRTHKFFPFSTIGLDVDANGNEYYIMFTSLSASSIPANVVFEIESLADNVIRATEAYECFLDITAMRGGVTDDFGETLIDVQALRILDQKIREADEELKKSREALASVLARQKMTEEEVKRIEARIAEYEEYAGKALAKGDERLGLEVAAKIAELMNRCRDETAQAMEMAGGVADLRKSVKQAENGIKRLEQQLDTVRATESLQKAQMTVARRYGGSQAKIQTALASLELIKKRRNGQACKPDAVNYPEKTADDRELEDKLKAVGIMETEAGAESILARIRKKMFGETETAG